MKGVVATVKDLETEEIIVVLVDRLAFSSPRLRDELAPEPFVPCPSRSNTSLPNLYGESPIDHSTLPTPKHATTPTAGSLDFLDKPRAQGNSNVRRNLDPDYAYIIMSRRDLEAEEYSGARHDDIRRQQGRRVNVPPYGVNLILFYGLGDQIIFMTAEAEAALFHARTGTLYFYKEAVGGFGNAYGEGYFGFWEGETPHVVPPATAPPLPVDFSAYQTAALSRGRFLTAETAEPVAAGQATLALAIQLAPAHYPLMAGPGVPLAKAEFDKVCAAKMGPATPSNTPAKAYRVLPVYKEWEQAVQA